LLKPKANMIYNEKSQCLVDLYGSYEDAETGLKLNGTLTLGENISDHSGTKAAYKAYGMIFLCLQLTLKLISQNYHEIYFTEQIWVLMPLYLILTLTE
jgi:hypothetical protein